MANQRNESKLNYGLPTLLFGEYFTENQDVPKVQDFEENFYWTRQPYKGFTKLYGALNTVHFEGSKSNKIQAFGETYEQIVPGLYKSTDSSNDFLHVTINNGHVEKISSQISDMLPVSQNMKMLKLFSFFAVAFSILYTIFNLLVILVQYIKNRQISVLRKREALLLLSNFIPLINVIVLGYRTINYAPYEALKIHFWINFAFIALVAVCIIAMLLEWRKEKILSNQKFRNVFSCLSSLLLVILIFLWELYY